MEPCFSKCADDLFKCLKRYAKSRYRDFKRFRKGLKHWRNKYKELRESEVRTRDALGYAYRLLNYIQAIGQDGVFLMRENDSLKVLDEQNDDSPPKPLNFEFDDFIKKLLNSNINTPDSMIGKRCSACDECSNCENCTICNANCENCSFCCARNSRGPFDEISDCSQLMNHKFKCAKIVESEFKKSFILKIQENIEKNTARSQAEILFLQEAIGDLFRTKNKDQQRVAIGRMYEVLKYGLQEITSKEHEDKNEAEEVFTKARQFALTFLRKDWKVAQDALAMIYFFNCEDEQNRAELSEKALEEQHNRINALRPLTIGNFEEFIKEFSVSLGPIEKEQLLLEIEKLLPTKIFAAPTGAFGWAITLDCGGIVVDKSIFDQVNIKSRIPTLGFILIHELCHLKKNTFQHPHPNYKTPELIKRVQNDMETGDCVELAIFKAVMDPNTILNQDVIGKVLENIENLKENEFEIIRKQLVEIKKACDSDCESEKGAKKKTRRRTCHRVKDRSSIDRNSLNRFISGRITPFCGK